MAAEADQPGFLRVQGEVEHAHPFLHVMRERLRFMLVLEELSRRMLKRERRRCSP
jgi:hypothetical protein